MNNLVFSNMLHRPARTAVSILGIAVGVLLIVFTIGLANGTLREQAKRAANVGAEIMVCASNCLGVTGAASMSAPVALSEEIEGVENVETAVPVGQNSVSTKDNNSGSLFIEGIDFNRYADVAGLRIVEGRKFSASGGEVITDTAFQKQRKLKVGDKIKLYERDFTIVGTYEPAAGARVKLPLGEMQEQLGSEGKVSSFLVKVKPGADAEAVAQSLQDKFPGKGVVLTRDLEELYMAGIPALNVFLNVIIGVAAVISALVVLLTMYTTVTERTRQIGIMKSLGMSNASIAWIVAQEALLITFCGIVGGILLTVILRFVLTRFTNLEVELDPLVWTVTLVVGLIGGAIGALYPALRAARLDAVEALSYE